MPRAPVIGMLADLLTLAELQARRDDLEDQLDAWMAAQNRRPTGANADQGAELEEASAEADFELQSVLGGLLDRGAFARILAAGLAQGHLTAERADQLTAEALEVASQTIGDAAGGAELERLLLAMPVCGDGAARAHAVNPDKFIQGLTVALRALMDAPGLQVRLFPMPVHPLAWAELTVDERYAVFVDLQEGRAAAGTQRLLEAHARVLDRAQYPAGDDRWTHADSPLRLWPVLASAPLDILREQPLEESLVFPQDSHAWGAWVRALNLASPDPAQPPQAIPGQSWLGAPLPIQDILPVTAIDQVHHLQTAVTTPLSLVEVTVAQDAEGRAWRTFDFEDADGLPHPYTLPEAWLGSTPAQREHAIARTFERWNGVGSEGLAVIPIPEPAPEPPPRQRPTLRVVR